MLANGNIYVTLTSLIIYLSYSLFFLKSSINIENILQICIATYTLYTCSNFLFDLIKGKKSLGDYENHKNVLFLGNIVLGYYALELFIKNF